MPFGIGLHVIVAIFFAVHAVRSGRELYWLLILFMFPFFGSVVYFFAVYLPQSRSSYVMQKGLQKVANVAVASIDPGRELREAKAAFEFTPTAQNQWRYADALLNADRVDEAVQQFELCLQGPFANDLEIQFAAANANMRASQPGRALQLLLAIRTNSAAFRSEAVTLMLARIYAQQGEHDSARREFELAVEKFGSVEARAEFAIWAASTGDRATAQHYYEELNQLRPHWSRAASEQFTPLLTRLEAALR